MALESIPRCRRSSGTALSCTLLLLLLLLAAPLRSAAQASCSAQLASVPGATTEWLDADTPPAACTKQLCTADAHEACSGAAPPLTSMQLVMSDEFTAAGRSLAVGAGDKRWTADSLWYAGTEDLEVYAPEQVTTAGGAAVITMEKEQSWGPTQRDNGTVWNVTKDYKSGFFSSWNKFCFSGGYVEAGLQFPGDDYISGFWPAFWLMGNLARPGYLATTGGFWPYTYNACGGGEVGLNLAGANKPQRLSACPDPPGFDRAKYGMQPGVGRGAPEIDMVEMKVPPSIDEETGEPIPLGLPRGGRPGQHPNAFNSMTLQSGPLLPNGTTWMDVNNGASPQGPLGAGMWLPQEAMAPGGPLDGMWTHATYWEGDFASGMLDDLRELYPEAKAQDMLQNIRPGNVVQDSVSVMATLNASYFSSFHKFGLDWKPDSYIRWYIDDILVYEVNKEALRGQSNGTYETDERLIPVEAMFIIFNFAMSNSFTAVDLDRLQFPAQYKIDYVRVYQDPAAINADSLTCSPEALPTEQWIACNRDSYVITQADQALIPAVCQELPTCRSEVAYELQGGDLYLNSDRPTEVPGVASPQECCKICQDEPKCGAWTWKPYFNLTCALKRPTGWTRVRMPKQYEGFFSGVVYDAGSSTPRGDTSPPSPSGAAQRGSTAAGAWRAAALSAAAALALLLLSSSSSGSSGSSGSGSVDEEYDVIVVGSGIGGLSCAGLLAKYGLKVLVCESHDVPGGAAHAWTVRQPGGGEGLYHFEAGPSLYSDMAGRGREANPLAHVLQALGEPLDLLTYKTWNVLLPEGGFLTEVGAYQFCEVLEEVRGPEAVAEWRRLQEAMRPLASAATMLPPVAFRQDLGVLRSAVLRYLPQLLQGGPAAMQLTGPFSKVLDAAGIRDPFIRNWLDLLSFLLSGLPADGTIAAEVAFMFNQWYKPDCLLEFPRGGSAAMVDALVRGLEKHGGRLLLRSHVEEILVDNGRAAGVRLRGGRRVRAARAVVSNASSPDTLRLLPRGAAPPQWGAAVEATPLNNSFMHLHLGFDATGLEGLELHHISVRDWDLPGGVAAPQNVVLISIASVIDPSLAPPGKHCLHAYTPATEPWELWEGLDRRSEEYARLKEERSQVLWEAVRKVIPDIDSRVEVSLVGTPLTHARYLRRHRGSYGPAIRAGEALFPWPATPLPGLYCASDSTFPGIGLPAVAASGAITANSLVGTGQHLALLEELGL